MFARMTDNARIALAHANQAAGAGRGTLIRPEHLLHGILEQDQCSACRVLAKMQVQLEALRESVAPAVSGRGPNVSPGEMKAVIMAALTVAQELEHECVGTQHLLLGLLATPGTQAFEILAGFGVDASRIRSEASASPELESSTPALGSEHLTTASLTVADGFGMAELIRRLHGSQMRAWVVAGLSLFLSVVLIGALLLLLLR